MARGQIVRLPSRALDVPLEDVERAESRIMRHLRHTPLTSTWLSRNDGVRLKVHLKLENLQVTEGFAVRGMLNAALDLSPVQLARGLVGYGLMHGPAAAYTAHVLQVPATVFLYPSGATPDLVRRLEYWGARTRVVGRSLAEAETAARAHAEQHGLTCIQSSASPSFIAGCATIALEMFEFQPRLDVLVSAVGFGPLIAGLACVAKQIQPRVRVVGVDRVERRNGYPFVEGQPHRFRRLQLGSILDRAASPSLDLIERFADDIVLVSQAEILDAAHRLWTELEVRTGSTGSSAIAALLQGRVPAAEDESVGAVISTAGGDGLF